MLLQRLREYAERLSLPPPMYQGTPIKYIIDLDSSGKFLGIVVTEGRGGKKDRGKEYLAPHIGRTSGTRAKLLADNGKYVLGIAGEGSRRDRVEECHRLFVDTVRGCAKATEETAVQAVLAFLENLDPATIPLPEDFDPSHNMTFRVGGVMPIDLPSVRSYWASRTIGEEAGDQGCLVCGRLCSPVRRLPFKIKGIPGGQPSGTAIISANEPAFESYGLEASLIAPTCQDCGEKFSKAANTLIRGEDTHLRISPLVYLFWTKGESGFSPVSFLSKPEPKEVRALIESAWKGREYRAIDEDFFYATAFSASGARVAVREWLEATVGEIRRNLARYFVLQKLVAPDGTEGMPLGLFPLAASLARDPRDVPPNVPKVLLRMALNGAPLPSWLLFQALKRARAEQRLTRPQAVLMKMVLLSNEPMYEEEGAMERLDLDNKNPAYLCGRLFSVLERVQRLAIPGISATIVDRFYGTASTAPASVLARLVKGGQSHLAKLRKQKPGAYAALQRRIEEVLSNLKSFPAVLTLEEQGLFALGYYHQKAADRAAAAARKLGEVSEKEIEE
jgi:CRISPR-associated protein Csd1